MTEEVEILETADISALMDQMGRNAREAAMELALCPGTMRDDALRAAVTSIRDSIDTILAANRDDLIAARKSGLSSAMLDRLALNPDRLESMAAGLETIMELPDPVGRLLDEWERPNGLHIQRIAVPLGVIGIIYESRPNVTADAAGLCIKSGNASILRGGSESFRSNHAIFLSLTAGLKSAGIHPAAIQMVPTTDRAAVGYLLSSMTDTVDVVVPRGGKNLIARVQEEARVPVIGHLEGICHVYLHESADAAMANNIVLNAKMRRTGICGAAETVLVDRKAAAALVPGVVAALIDAGCEVRGDERVKELAPGTKQADENDWYSEYLDAIISIKVVDDVSAAISHIRKYGSNHTECIVAQDDAAARKFLTEVDSAIVLHNASTQFADGGEFGMGGEIGIATGRIHARGPVGAEQLTSYKYVVRGSGQIRP
jgi:glutamate-5-semialdehyde dehydrogenase